MNLHPYQVRAAGYVTSSPGTYLALDVGLGKSAITLTALSELIGSGEVYSVLVVAPKKVAEHTWPAETKLWGRGLQMHLISGTPKERMKAVMNPAPVHVIGIDNLTWLIEQFGGRWPYQALVIDEAQKFKDPSSKRFKALKKVCKHFDRVVLLSATPASESYLGLWSQMFLIDGGQRLGKSYTAFKEAFFAADYMGWSWALRPGAEAKIHERINDVMVSMRAEDYLDLPERIDNVIKIPLSDAAQTAYNRLEADYLLPHKGEVISAANAAVLGNKLLQLSGGAVYDEERKPVVIHGEKVQALADLIDEANGNPVLVFYGYRHEVDRIRKAIKGAEDLDVERWNRGEQRVALAHAASAGAGLNLQAGGSVICWFSLPWSLELYTQACGRLHRQGQTKNVIVHHLVCDGTIDEKIIDVLTAKSVAQDGLLSALRRFIHEQTN